MSPRLIVLLVVDASHDVDDHSGTVPAVLTQRNIMDFDQIIALLTEAGEAGTILSFFGDGLSQVAGFAGSVAGLVG